MDLIDILIVILIIIATVLCLYLIKLVKRLFISIDIMESKLKEFDAKITPLISDLQEMANSGNTIANYAKEQADFAISLVDGIKSKFGGFVTKKQTNVSPQSSAQNLVKNLKALFKGATTFISEIKK